MFPIEQHFLESRIEAHGCEAEQVHFGRSKRVATSAVMLLVLAATAGCYTEPSQFNDHIVIRQREIARKAQDFRHKTDELDSPVIANPDMRGLGNLHTALLGAVTKCRTELARESVPSSADAQNFYHVYAAYLEKEEALVRNQFEQIKQIAMNPNLIKAERSSRIKPIYQQIDTEENAANQGVIQAQAAFSEHYQLNLVYAPAQKK